MTIPSQDSNQPPWYRQFWPWFIIAIPASAVIGGFVTLWLAITHPESLVVDDGEYLKIRDELRAQDHGEDGDAREPDGQP
jgi:hypothetical protein